jgi:hypothetical protein
MEVTEALSMKELPSNIKFWPHCSESYPVQVIHKIGEIKHISQQNSEGNRDLIGLWWTYNNGIGIYIPYEGAEGRISPKEPATRTYHPIVTEDAHIKINAHSHINYLQ